MAAAAAQLAYAETARVRQLDRTVGTRQLDQTVGTRQLDQTVRTRQLDQTTGTRQLDRTAGTRQLSPRLKRTHAHSNQGGSAPLLPRQHMSRHILKYLVSTVGCTAACCVSIATCCVVFRRMALTALLAALTVPM